MHTSYKEAFTKQERKEIALTALYTCIGILIVCLIFAFTFFSHVPTYHR